jgi:hypothetical protein
MQRHSNQPSSKRQPPFKDPNRTFPVFYGFFKIMGKADALFIQDLIDWGSKLPNNKSNFFPCSVQFLEDNGWTRNEQRRRIRTLTQLGFIEIKTQGSPRQRWVRIDFSNIDCALAAMKAWGRPYEDFK